MNFRSRAITSAGAVTLLASLLANAAEPSNTSDLECADEGFRVEQADNLGLISERCQVNPDVLESQVKRELEERLRKLARVAAMLGDGPYEISSPRRETLHFGLRVSETARGLRVDQVDDDGAAARAGVRHGDVIVTIDGVATSGTGRAVVAASLADVSNKGARTVGVDRNGRRLDMPVVPSAVVTPAYRFTVARKQ